MSSIDSINSTNARFFADNTPAPATPAPTTAPQDTFEPKPEGKPQSKPQGKPVPPKVPVATVESKIIKKLKELGIKANNAVHDAAGRAGRFGLDLADKVQGAVAAVLQRVRG